MNLSQLDNALWAAGFVGHVTLLATLLFRGRWRAFPVFTVLIAFDTALTITLYLLYKYASHTWYARIYWSADVVDFCLQLALVAEIARIVLSPTGSWIRDALKYFLLLGGLCFGFVFFFSLGVS